MVEAAYMVRRGCDPDLGDAADPALPSPVSRLPSPVSRLPSPVSRFPDALTHRRTYHRPPFPASAQLLQIQPPSHHGLRKSIGPGIIDSGDERLQRSGQQVP